MTETQAPYTTLDDALDAEEGRQPGFRAAVERLMAEVEAGSYRLVDESEPDLRRWTAKRGKR